VSVDDANKDTEAEQKLYLAGSLVRSLTPPPLHAGSLQGEYIY